MRAIRCYDPTLLYEVTARTIGGTFLFDPDLHDSIGPAFDAIFARAQQRHGVTIYAYFVMSNHYHGLYAAPDPDAMADFLNDVHASMARWANRANGRKGPVFAGRAKVTPVLMEETTQANRLAYIMGQAVKVKGELGMMGWRGANTNRALIEGAPIVGRYFDYHQKTLDARHKLGPKADEAYVSHSVVELAVLPCWDHLATFEQLQKYQALAANAEAKYSNAPFVQRTDIIDGQSRAGLSNAGPSLALPDATDPRGHDGSDDAGQRREPRSKPKLPKKRGRRPLIVHAACRQQAEEFEQAFALICAAYQQARRQLSEQAALMLQGLPAAAVEFPANTFPCGVRTGRLRREIEFAKASAATRPAESPVSKWHS